MLVYAQEEQKDTIAILEQLRKTSAGIKLPIPLAVSIHKRSHFYFAEVWAI
jgi:hypothetical protein